ncbi:imidazole glycerol phosphate synthase subunit HisH [Candidatus Berkiella cookevillensis]|uniref:Imidazole glycerol phosphate synthase subunit HisH n=1 Tax=Candidatus Berkiella cookevillensis TaxID=437022 RepID=A0A0Q9YSR5_9GAMM|nr:imidazole glycerol phosphate synthase subunit HisH [Candidatus Berkiella cookevillensis]MCS5707684.1 imidazole glycerol phosphate synthase subunit HisH [Candidatus Berkiella cookevillensis]
MTRSIGLIGCATSNIGSVSHAVEFLGFTPVIIQQEAQIKHCSHLILPGVGSFYSGMQYLANAKLLEPFIKAFHAGTPILGICLGMQLFAQKSDEFGEHIGLNLISNHVKKINQANTTLKLPHVGWNNVIHNEKSLLFKNIPQSVYFYFTHSFAYSNENTSYTTSTTQYHATSIISSIEHENLFGVQFHPEKSQQFGLTLLRNFLTLC